MRKETKNKKVTVCECDCKRDIKKGISYYRDGKYYYNKTHYQNMKKGRPFGGRKNK